MIKGNAKIGKNAGTKKEQSKKKGKAKYYNEQSKMLGKISAKNQQKGAK